MSSRCASGMQPCALRVCWPPAVQAAPATPRARWTPLPLRPPGRPVPSGQPRAVVCVCDLGVKSPALVLPETCVT